MMELKFIDLLYKALKETNQELSKSELKRLYKQRAIHTMDVSIKVGKSRFVKIIFKY